jgi:hypothetical protein
MNPSLEHLCAISKAPTHRDLAEKLRRQMTLRKEFFTYKRLADQIQVSYTLLHLFHNSSRNVCIVIMNRLANYFGIEYEIKNYTGRDSEADAVGIHALRDLLRQKLTEAGPNQIRGIARSATEIALKEGLSESKISHEWLRLFHQGKEEPCFVKMHGLAEHFKIKYAIRNYQESDIYRVA